MANSLACQANSTFLSRMGMLAEVSWKMTLEKVEAAVWRLIAIGSPRKIIDVGGATLDSCIVESRYPRCIHQSSGAEVRAAIRIAERGVVFAKNFLRSGPTSPVAKSR